MLYLYVNDARYLKKRVDSDLQLQKQHLGLALHTQAKVLNPSQTKLHSELVMVAISNSIRTDDPAGL